MPRPDAGVVGPGMVELGRAHANITLAGGTVYAAGLCRVRVERGRIYAAAGAMIELSPTGDVEGVLGAGTLIFEGGRLSILHQETSLGGLTLTDADERMLARAKAL